MCGKNSKAKEMTDQVNANTLMSVLHTAHDLHRSQSMNFRTTNAQTKTSTAT